MLVYTARRDALLRLLGFGVLALTLVGALLASFVVTPEDIEAGRVVLSPPCALRSWAGIDCPACGLTRAFAALSHGRVGDALRYNLAAPLFYVAFWVTSVFALRGSRAALGDLALVKR